MGLKKSPRKQEESKIMLQTEKIVPEALRQRPKAFRIKHEAIKKKSESQNISLDEEIKDKKSIEYLFPNFDQIKTI